VGGAVGGTVLELTADSDLAEVDIEAPLLQGVCAGPGGTAWATGEDGAVFTRRGGKWEADVTAPVLGIESLHAVWMDPDGGVWSAGGDVLSAQLDNGALIVRGADIPAPDPALFRAPIPEPTDPVCPPDAIDLAPGESIAHQWNEQVLNAIRRDIPRPGVHARNLFHVSVAMWDAWAAFDDVADGYFYTERHTAADVAAARDEAIAYAAYRVASHRYDASRSVGAPVSLVCFADFMRHLGYDPDVATLEGDSPAALGNRIGALVIAESANDGANEANDYADTTGWAPTNSPMFVDAPGAGEVVDIDTWQQLILSEAVTQNGIALDGGLQGYIGPNWGEVTPFALVAQEDGSYFPVPEEWMPYTSNPRMHDWVIEVIRLSSLLDPADGIELDISPAGWGNNPLGTSDGSGYDVNPVTGAPYPPRVVLQADFGRVLAEFWADGPHSETPPGHWNTIANDVTQHPLMERRWGGEGEVLDPLEWDVRMYLALNGATHDAAIAAWGLKRDFLSARPISLVRYLGGLGQSSDPSLPSYHEDGLRLVPGLVELITEESSAPGERHAHLANYVGQIAVRSWRGEPGDVDLEVGGVAWIRATEWMPYQLRTFVTPAFPGFTSGHSTFSRSAAEALALMTGSPYFPGGLGTHSFEPGYLRFELGPSEEIVLEWATYYDAADQAGLSRLWGGIHIAPDDFFGRSTGSQIGPAAFEKAQTYIDGTARP
jgi:hypothetical protein